MIRRPPRSTRTDTFFPSTALFRSGAAAFQRAEGLGRVIDQLHYEEVAPARLADIENALGDLAGHWQASWRRLSLLVEQWPAMLAATGHIDRADRRNRLLGRVSKGWRRSEEHTSELQSLMRISYAVFCLKKKK